MMYYLIRVNQKDLEKRGENMKINKEKYLLARAKACMGPKDLVAAGIPRGTLSRVTCGEIRPETAGKIAKILGVDVTEIIEQ